MVNEANETSYWLVLLGKTFKGDFAGTAYCSDCIFVLIGLAAESGKVNIFFTFKSADTVCIYIYVFFICGIPLEIR